MGSEKRHPQFDDICAGSGRNRKDWRFKSVAVSPPRFACRNAWNRRIQARGRRWILLHNATPQPLGNRKKISLSPRPQIHHNDIVRGKLSEQTHISKGMGRLERRNNSLRSGRKVETPPAPHHPVAETYSARPVSMQPAVFRTNSGIIQACRMEWAS